jgi:uncharacterized membrane protein YkoI
MQCSASIQFVPGFVAFLSVTLLLSSCGKTESVPDTVSQAFASQHPGAQPKWVVQPYGYEAVFTQNGQEYEAEYTASGEWLETEYEVPASQFSPQVLQRIQQQYPGSIVTKHEIELTPTGTFYEVEIQQDGQEQELYFDGQANPVANANEDA